jgi:hypothetical protein
MELHQAKRSTTLLGITQASPILLKIVFQRAHAISQWSRIWSIESSFFLHMQYYSTTMICRFLRLVRIFSKAADHAKKVTFKGTLFCQILLQRSIIMGNKNIVARSNIKQPSPRKNPTKTVFTTQSHSNGIQQSGE